MGLRGGGGTAPGAELARLPGLLAQFSQQVGTDLGKAWLSEAQIPQDQEVTADN